MRFRLSRMVYFWLIGSVSVGFAATIPVDCSKGSLAVEAEKAKAGDTIIFTGVCNGPVVIRESRVTLSGASGGVIDGQGRDAVTIAGASEVILANLEIRNGANGILGTRGANIILSEVITRNNTLNGVSLQTSSSATLIQVTTSGNSLHGLDLQTGSAAVITGTFTASGNRVFGINANGSSLTFSRANATASGNAIGIQIATAANTFLTDPSTVLNVSNNLATGLTIVSGAHLVSFGATINASGNSVFGVSVNSKGGLDLDAGSTLNISGSGRDGLVLQQQSVITAFNNPQVSGAAGFSTINSSGNGGNGVGVLTGSTLTLVNQARINSTNNRAIGLLVDNGAGVTIRNSTVTGNTTRDLQLSFGVRADLQSLTLGSWACDATVLVRGANAVTCPH